MLDGDQDSKQNLIGADLHNRIQLGAKLDWCLQIRCAKRQFHACTQIYFKQLEPIYTLFHFNIYQLNVIIVFQGLQKIITFYFINLFPYFLHSKVINNLNSLFIFLNFFFLITYNNNQLKWHVDTRNNNVLDFIILNICFGFLFIQCLQVTSW